MTSPSTDTTLEQSFGTIGRGSPLGFADFSSSLDKIMAQSPGTPTSSSTPGGEAGMAGLPEAFPVGNPDQWWSRHSPSLSPETSPETFASVSPGGRGSEGFVVGSGWEKTISPPASRRPHSLESLTTDLGMWWEDMGGNDGERDLHGESEESVDGSDVLKQISTVTSTEPSNEREVFVGGLREGSDTVHITDVELEGYFNRFGKVESISINRDDRTHRGRGFAFVKFETEGAALNAVMADASTHVIRGVMVSVQWSKGAKGGKGERTRRRGRSSACICGASKGSPTARSGSPCSCRGIATKDKELGRGAMQRGGGHASSCSGSDGDVSSAPVAAAPRRTPPPRSPVRGSGYLPAVSTAAGKYWGARSPPPRSPVHGGGSGSVAYGYAMDALEGSPSSPRMAAGMPAVQVATPGGGVGVGVPVVVIVPPEQAARMCLQPQAMYPHELQAMVAGGAAPAPAAGGSGPRGMGGAAPPSPVMAGGELQFQGLAGAQGGQLGARRRYSAPQERQHQHGRHGRGNGSQAASPTPGGGQRNHQGAASPPPPLQTTFLPTVYMPVGGGGGQQQQSPLSSAPRPASVGATPAGHLPAGPSSAPALRRQHRHQRVDGRRRGGGGRSPTGSMPVVVGATPEAYGYYVPVRMV